MRSFISAAVVAATFAIGPIFASAPAEAVTLDFSSAANPPNNLVDFSQVPQTFGDTPSVNVSYRSLAAGGTWGQTATEIADYVLYWKTPNYSGDSAIYQAVPESKGEITLQSLVPTGLFTSFVVTFGAFDSQEQVSDIRFYDANWNSLGLTGSTPVLGTGKTLSALGFTPTDIIRIQWGDTFDVGLLSISYELSAYNPDPVPLPPAVALFASALIGGGVVAWRKKRKQNAEAASA